MNSIALLLVLGVLFPIGSVIACVCIGHHYARKCLEHANACADVDERFHFLVEEADRQHERTEVLPRVPASHEQTDPLRLTRGQRQRAEAEELPPGRGT